jgi:hypothetical protein
MHQLIYVSSARADLSEDDLHDVLSCARKKNRELGITGMLVCLDGYFVQVLEGEAERVRELYAKIKTDSRHADTKVVTESEIAERAFPDWSMGFREASRDDLYMAGFLALIRRALAGRTGQADAVVLRTIIKTFYRPSDGSAVCAETESAISLAS